MIAALGRGNCPVAARLQPLLPQGIDEVIDVNLGEIANHVTGHRIGKTVELDGAIVGVFFEICERPPSAVWASCSCVSKKSLTALPISMACTVATF
jgi:hypothetical protein